MKAAKKKVWLLLWPVIAAFQLLFSSQLAPGKSIPVSENRTSPPFSCFSLRDSRPQNRRSFPKTAPGKFFL